MKSATPPNRIMTLGNHRAGNTLLVAVLLLAVLSLVGATVLQTVSNRYDYSQKVVGWSEALNAAEAGADYAFTNCVWSLGNSGITAWTDWKKYDTGTSSWVPVTDAADGYSQFSGGNRIIYDSPAGSHLV